MNESVLLGRGKELIAVPWRAWLGHLDDVPEHGRSRLAFMTEEHHRVRYFVVRELPRAGTVLTPEFIASALNLTEDRVQQILAELEKKLFFLWRDEAGAVAWAFPVTVDQTPHVIRFSSGERLYGA
ncbi:MAG: hypothetical protein JSW55_00480 [Chloroflexota bacterium]|nr:MAG: hypothetical protein JSW55_00480 [Chloroflexota bacterium]